MMRILVCGGRDYADQAMLFGYLDMSAERHGDIIIIQGGASGADELARMWCHTRRHKYYNYPADWRTYGRAAGPIRNQSMLDDGQPDIVAAFPGGRGTADMVRRARAAGVAVEQIPTTPEKDG